MGEDEKINEAHNMEGIEDYFKILDLCDELPDVKDDKKEKIKRALATAILSGIATLKDGYKDVIGKSIIDVLNDNKFFTEEQSRDLLKKLEEMETSKQRENEEGTRDTGRETEEATNNDPEYDSEGIKKATGQINQELREKNKREGNNPVYEEHAEAR